MPCYSWDPIHLMKKEGKLPAKRECIEKSPNFPYPPTPLHIGTSGQKYIGPLLRESHKGCRAVSLKLVETRSQEREDNRRVSLTQKRKREVKSRIILKITASTSNRRHAGKESKPGVQREKISSENFEATVYYETIYKVIQPVNPIDK